MNFHLLKDCGFYVCLFVFCLIRMYFNVLLVDEEFLLVSVLYLKKDNTHQTYITWVFPFLFCVFILGNFAHS